MIEEIILPFMIFYKKEKINYKSRLEKNKIGYKQLLRDLKTKEAQINESVKQNKEQAKQTKAHFKKERRIARRNFRDQKIKIKLQYMDEVSQNKNAKETVKLSKKSKSNLHQILFAYARQSYDDKKNSLVVQEIAPSGELLFSIKKRVFKDLNAYGDKNDDRVYASEKDLLYTNINIGSSLHKIPILLRYSGACVPVFNEKIRSDTFDKFSNENEHHIMLLSERLREIKAPRTKISFGKKSMMWFLIILLFLAYLGYRYMTQGGLF